MKKVEVDVIDPHKLVSVLCFTKDVKQGERITTQNIECKDIHWTALLHDHILGDYYQYVLGGTVKVDTPKGAYMFKCAINLPQ